jgi:putative phage-type endonuclease
MRLVDLTQRTPAWHAWRMEGVTASEAPVLLGSPFKTVWRLWAEKRGLVLEADLSRNPHVQRGLREESDARRRYEERHGDLLLPLCAESSREPILRASFDGLTDSGRPVELKAPTEANFRNAVAYGEQSVLYQRYYAQVQTQIFVAEADAGVLSLHLGRDCLDLDVPRDEACIGRIVEAAQAFWDRVRSGKEPPPDPERDLYRPAGTDLATWQRLAGDYRRLERERQTLATRLKALDAALSDLEPPLLALMGGFLLADAEGLRITRFLQQGAVDYKAALKALRPDTAESDLNAYRRTAAERVRITVRPAAGPPEAPAASTSPEQVPQVAFADGWF